MKVYFSEHHNQLMTINIHKTMATYLSFFIPYRQLEMQFWQKYLSFMMVSRSHNRLAQIKSVWLLSNGTYFLKKACLNFFYVYVFNKSYFFSLFILSIYFSCSIKLIFTFVHFFILSRDTSFSIILRNNILWSFTR